MKFDFVVVDEEGKMVPENVFVKEVLDKAAELGFAQSIPAMAIVIACLAICGEKEGFESKEDVLKRLHEKAQELLTRAVDVGEKNGGRLQ